MNLYYFIEKLSEFDASGKVPEYFSLSFFNKMRKSNKH
jgi:hypothetical protein